MYRFNTLILLTVFLISQSALSQTLLSIEPNNEKYNLMSFDGSELTDYGNLYDAIKNPSRSLIKKDEQFSLQLDTLTQYFERSSGIKIYAYKDQNQTVLPVTGTNGRYHLLGMKYEIEYAKIIGVLMSFGFKSIQGEPDSLAILVSKGDEATGLPTNPLLTNTGFSTLDLDTNYFEPAFTSVYFSEQAEIEGKFAISIQVWTQMAESDLVAIHSNAQGDARGENTAFFSIFQDQVIGSYNFEDFQITMGDGKYPNFDLMILPIVEVNVTDVNSYYENSDFKFNGVSPNPATEKIFFDLELKNDIGLEISLIDNNGKLLLTKLFDYVTIQDAFINIGSLSAGVYHYIIRSGRNYCSGKFIKI